MLGETGNLQAGQVPSALLIATATRIHAVLHSPIEVDGGGFASVDKVVIYGRFASKADGEKMLGLVDTVQADGKPRRWEDTHSHRFRFMCAIGCGRSSAVLGIGWNKPNGAIDMTMWKLEYNPNLVADSVYLKLLMRKIARFSKIDSIELKRWDLAIDIPAARYLCRMLRDKRKYQYFAGTSITEYLGKRSKPGHVKLYDKTRELKEKDGTVLDSDWTRLEITCSGDWDAGEIRNHIPKVIVSKDKADAGTATIWCLSSLASLAIAHGESIEPYLHPLDSRTRQKVVNLLVDSSFDIDTTVIEKARELALSEVSKFGIAKCGLS